MKRRRLFCLMVSVLLLLTGMAANAEAAVFEADFSGILEGGVLIEGILPGMSKEEVEEVGIEFAEEIISAYTGDNGILSEVWMAETPVFLAGVQADGVSFQFADGKLINICLDTGSIDVLGSVFEQLAAQLGDPVMRNIGEGDSAAAMYQWLAYVDGIAVQAGATVAFRDGQPAFGSVQLSWLDPEVFGDGLKNQTVTRSLMEAQIEGLKERSFVLIEGILPDMSKAEVEAAGVVFDEKPMSTRTTEGRSFTTTDWIDERKIMRFRWQGRDMQSALFQFDDDRLTCIQLISDDEQLVSDMKEALIRELGETYEVIDNPNNQTLIWRFTQDNMTGAVYHAVSRTEEGAFYKGSMQVSWFPADLYPDLQTGK